MKKAIVLLMALALASPVLAADIARDPAVVVEGAVAQHDDVIQRGNAAVLALLDGAFTDLSAVYATALERSGFTPDIYYDPAGGVDYSDYSLLLVSCADNWWHSPNYAIEIESWRSYMAGGGRMILIGQDFLYGSGDYGFPQEYFGMISAVEDVNGGDASLLTWTGTDMLDGLGGGMQPCYSANSWYTDDVSGVTGLCRWSTQEHPGSFGGGCASMVGVFSVVEFGCEPGVDGSIDALDRIHGTMFPVATEPASFSSVKSLY